MGKSLCQLRVSATAILSSLFIAFVSHAETVEIDAFQSGYVTGSGLVRDADGNYLTGQFDDEEYRGYFIFDLSALEGLQVTSATFRLDTDDYFSADLTETVNFFQYTGAISILTSAPTASATAFEDLGDGTLLATQIYSEALQDDVLDIVLNSEAIAALNNAISSGSIAFGAVMFSLSGNGDQYVYGQSDDLGSIRQLQLETQAVPEPATIGLLAVAGLALLNRRRRKNG